MHRKDEWKFFFLLRSNPKTQQIKSAYLEELYVDALSKISTFHSGEMEIIWALKTDSTKASRYK